MDKKSWKLLDAMELHHKHPKKYPVPPNAEKDRVKRKSHIELGFSSKKWGVEIERAWVRVRLVKPDGTFISDIISSPEQIHDLKCGDRVEFNKDHILRIYA